MANTIDHLRVAHHLALQAHQHPKPEMAALVRAWPQLADAAHRLHERLPAAADGDRIVERIALDGQSQDRATRRTLPAEAVPDQRLFEIATALDAASGSSAAAGISPGHVAEAQHLIASTLWASARLVARTARDHSYDVLVATRRPDAAGIAQSSAAKQTARRFDAIEQLAAAGLGLRRPSGPDQSDAGVLRQAIATWDVEAHRVLLTNRSTAVLHVLSHQQSATMQAFGLFVNAAAANGVIDPTTYHRLIPALESSAATWASVRDTAAEFSFGPTAIPTALIDTSDMLNDRFSSAVTVVTHQDHRAVLGALSSHLASAVTISAAAADLLSDGDLRAPARAVARVLAERRPDLPHSPVDPVDIHRGVSIRLPGAARTILNESVTHAMRDADEALRRTSGLGLLDRRLPDPTTVPTPASPTTPITSPSTQLRRNGMPGPAI